LSALKNVVYFLLEICVVVSSKPAFLLANAMLVIHSARNLTNHYSVFRVFRRMQLHFITNFTLIQRMYLKSSQLDGKRITCIVFMWKKYMR